MRVVHENSRDRPGCLFFNLKIIGCDGSLYVHDQLVALKKRYQNIKKVPGSIRHRTLSLKNSEAFHSQVAGEAWQSRAAMLCSVADMLSQVL
jgi:hypothetical protein